MLVETTIVTLALYLSGCSNLNTKGKLIKQNTCWKPEGPIGEALEEAITKGTIDVRDRKRDKALSAIAELDRTTLQQWQQEHARLTHEASEQQKHLSDSETTQQIRSMKQEHERARAAHQRIIQKQNQVEKDVARIDIKQALADLQTALRTATKTDVTVL